MKVNPVGWFEIYVQDMNRARAFYEAVFSTKLGKLPGPDIDMWCWPMSQDCNTPVSGASGALVHMPGCPSGGNSTLVYFSCEDCGAEEGRGVPAGGEVLKTKFAIGPYGFISLVIDSEGNMFGLHSMK